MRIFSIELTNVVVLMDILCFQQQLCIASSFLLFFWWIRPLCLQIFEVVGYETALCISGAG